MARHRPPVSIIDEIDETPPAAAPAVPEGGPKRRYPNTHRTTVYIPQEVHEAMRRVAFDHRIKEHDIIMQGLDLVLREKYGMPGVAARKAKR